MHMSVSDLNECLSELPEISVMEFFRSHRPIEGPFRHTGQEAVDAHSENTIGPILVDDRGIEYVVPVADEGSVARVLRPNGTTRFQEMTRGDVAPDVRRALLAFAALRCKEKKAA